MYKRNEHKWFKHADFIFLDIICIIAAFLGSFAAHFGHLHLASTRLYMDSLIFYALIDAVVIFFTEEFRNVVKRPLRDEVIMTAKHVVTVWMLHILWLVITQKTLYYSRAVMLVTLLTYFFVSLAARVLRKHRLRNRDFGDKKRSILILGKKEDIKQAAKNISENGFGLYEISGVCVLGEDLKGEVIEKDGVVVANTSDVLNYAATHRIDEVYFCDYSEVRNYKDILYGFAEAGISTHVVLKDLDCVNGSKQFIEKIGDENVITAAISTMSNAQLFAKRALDIAGGLAGCLLTLLITPFIAYKIKKEDPGPIIYKSVRVGQNGKKFNMYKFRSMVMNADELKERLQSQNKVSNGMMFKIDNDPRIIGGEKGIGGFIRRTSLDEFPQFFNVLKGDMSLVGTRPPTLDEWVKYSPHHRARLSTKPGITGLWQISGRSDITDFEEVVRLDREYITNWSLWNDIKILFKTVMVVITKKGSY